MNRTLKDKSAGPFFPIRKTDGLDIKIGGASIDLANRPVRIPTAALTLFDNQTNLIFFDPEAASIVCDSSLSDFPKRSKALYKIVTASGEIVSIEDCRAIARMSAHSSSETHTDWLKDVTVNNPVAWTDFDLSAVIDIPANASGVKLEVHAKETGAVAAGDNVYVLLRKPGDANQSQWKLIAPQISGRWATRTVEVKFGEDGKSIQYKIDVASELQLKVGLAGWLYG